MKAIRGWNRTSRRYALSFSVVALSVFSIAVLTGCGKKPEAAPPTAIKTAAESTPIQVSVTPVKIQAWDNTQTAFAGRTLSWTGPDNNSFRAGVSLKWIKTNGTVWGRSTYFLDYHRLAYDASVSSECPATWHA